MIYSNIGRPSIPPEQLLRAMVLQAHHTIRSERFLMEQIDLHLAYRCFVGLSADEPVWDPATFTKTRDRVLVQEVSQEFFDSARKINEQYDLESDEHSSVNRTQLEAWASLKSFPQKGEIGDDESKPPSDQNPGNPSADFRVEKRCNQDGSQLPVIAQGKRERR
jgi:transposase